MDKEEVLLEFIKGLRIALNNAAAYNKEHPYFLKTAQDFALRINQLFAFQNPIEIIFSPASIFLGGRSWENNQLYEELASAFHLRKIKSIKITPGFSPNELVEFLSGVSLPVKEILRKGGVRNIAKQENLPHFYVQDLDYSQFLQNQGEECKDIWVYLFKNSTQTGDTKQIKEITQNFEKIISNFKSNDFSQDLELRTSIKGFLDYLKDREKAGFLKCSKNLLKKILQDRVLSEKDSLEGLKGFFAELNREDFADVLLEELFKDEGFNLLSFQLFSRLAGESKEKEIASALEEKIKRKDIPQGSNRAIKRIKELFSSPDPSFISIFYHDALKTLFKDSSFKGSFELDAGIKNYYFILLNLLSQESDKEKLGLIYARLRKDYDLIIKEAGEENLGLLADILWKKKAQDPAFADLLGDLYKRTALLLESRIFEGSNLKELEATVEQLQESALGYEYYIGKIFNQRKISPVVVKALLKFFPEKVEDIYAELEKCHSDIDFLADFSGALSQLGSPGAAEAIKKIYDFSNEVVKIEILKSMQANVEIDEEFVFSVLAGAKMLLKKEALMILRSREELLKKALDRLFDIPSAFGRNNNLLMDHIMLVEELSLTQAQAYLLSLSKRPFFWNRRIRRRAKDVLAKLK